MFGKRLATLRKQKELSQYELADRLGFSRGQIANYEQGKREPDYGTLEKIADFFEVTTDYLLGRTDIPSPPDTDSDSRLEYYKHKIATEFPDVDLMFKDMETLSAEEMKEVYEYIKFKISQKGK